MLENKSSHLLPSSVQFSPVTQSCLTLCNPMDCSMPGFPVHHQCQEFAQTCPSSQWCHSTISSSVVPFSSCPQSFPASGSFPRSWFFASGGQIIEASTSVLTLPMNIQDWFPLGWPGWISLQSKGLSRLLLLEAYIMACFREIPWASLPVKDHKEVKLTHPPTWGLLF